MKLIEIAALIEPSNFSPFTIVTKGGLRMYIPNWEFIDIPPNAENGEPSYVVAYTRGTVIVPKLIDLDAIDHIDYKPKAKSSGK
jgi:hypothetical protein